MNANRLEAFSDGVLAIVITIMVLELKVPHGTDFAALAPLLPVFLSYVLSFIYIGIYWNNHHHMFKLAKSIDGAVLWANLHLLFWLSLLPFTTGWVGENHFERWPVVLYGFNLLFCAIAYWLLRNLIIRNEGAGSELAEAVAGDYKGKLSPVLYIVGIVAAWLFAAWAGMVVFVIVAVIWLVPDRRLEKAIVGKARNDRMFSR